MLFFSPANKCISLVHLNRQKFKADFNVFNSGEDVKALLNKMVGLEF